MNRSKQTIILSIILLALLLMAGCGDAPPTPDVTPKPDNPPSEEPIQEYPEPPLVQTEPQLTGIQRTPDIWITASRQSHEALAAFLHTTQGSLRHANPRLPDPVEAGELVMIPTAYLSEGDTLTNVAEKTGLTLEMLQETNLSISTDEIIAEGMLVAVPPIYIVPENTLLSSTASVLGTDDNTLLSANPSLRGDEILAGTVLVIPLAAAEKE